MSRNPVIRARAIQKAYRVGASATPVLKSVDLEVRRGQCVYLAGPSGSGKSTLLSILGCILTADAGKLEILGEDVTTLTKRKGARFRRENIGFVFQRFHLFRGLCAWENVRVALDLLGYGAREAKAISLELLASVGLADKAESPVLQLSMGQRQRVALARALAGSPELILADEPTASLDAVAGLNAMELLRALARERNTTVVVVTHDSRIFHLADRIIHLEDGRLEELPSGGAMLPVESPPPTLH